MTDAPLFSVLMPTYNCADFLRAAVDSVRVQTWTDWELLIVDDGSKDETPALLDDLEALAEPRLRIWRRANAGRAAALNFMIDQARGTWVAFQDADDRCRPDRLALAAARIAAPAPPAALMSGHALIIDDRTVAPRAEAKDAARCRADVADLRMPAHDPTMIVRRDVAAALRFHEPLRIGAGVDFTFRLVETHDLEVIGAPLYEYRVNPASVTRANVSRRVAGVRSVLDRARVRRGQPPFTDVEFAAHQGPALRDPTNNLIGHFTDSAYLQVEAGDRAGALRTAMAALRVAPPAASSLKPLIYALSPRPLARIIRRR